MESSENCLFPDELSFSSACRVTSPVVSEIC
jgi:hypothetical protein